MYSWWDWLGRVAARDGVWVLPLWGVELDLLPGVWHLNARGNLFSLNLVCVSPLIFPREISEKKNHDNKFLKGRWVSHFPEQGRKNWLLFLGCERDPSGKFDIISFDCVTVYNFCKIPIDCYIVWCGVCETSGKIWNSIFFCLIALSICCWNTHGSFTFLWCVIL